MLRLFINISPSCSFRGLLSATLFTFILIANANACDVCGGSNGSTNLGYVSGHQRSFIGFRSSFRKFASTDHIHKNELDKGSTEQFLSTEWVSKFHFHKRLQLIAFIPYQFQSRKQEGETIRQNGLGDISLLANSIFLNTNQDDAKWVHLIQGGVGFKLPTGKWDAMYKGNFIHYNMQLGTGSWDFLSTISYSISSRKFSTIFELNYRYNTANKLDYRFGDKINLNLTSFYTFEKGKQKVIPMAGLQYELAQADVSRNLQEEMTGGYAWKGVVGLQAIRYPINVGLMTGIPIETHFSEGHVKPKASATCQLIYFFKLKK